jgi:hypothetical protein
MRRRLLFAAFGLVAAVLTFGFGAAFSRGTIWHFSSWEAGADRASLWEALEHVSDCWGACGGDHEFWDLQHRNLTHAGVLLLVAVGVGIAIYWAGVGRGRSDETADQAGYQDTPTGAVPDRRAGPKPAGEGVAPDRLDAHAAGWTWRRWAALAVLAALLAVMALTG